MDNKLSELSKPVAWMHRQLDISKSNSDKADLSVDVRARYSDALYSQEYVDALKQRLVTQKEYYESVIADGSQRIAELGAKLATPVRLPSKNDDEFWFDGVFQVAKFDRAVERAISAAGFKCVGGE